MLPLSLGNVPMEFVNDDLGHDSHGMRTMNPRNPPKIPKFEPRNWIQLNTKAEVVPRKPC